MSYPTRQIKQIFLKNIETIDYSRNVYNFSGYCNS